MLKVLVLVCIVLFSGCATKEHTYGKAMAKFLYAPYLNYRCYEDCDHDGINDAMDIVKSVRDYVATDPIYMSKYYANGYPDDGYGVCTDVVAFGCLGAGYDLQYLVDTHVKEHRDLYTIQYRDDNIDFRRVQNLEVYFRMNHIELSIDPTDIMAWQPGDIIVFESHIGIVGDKRNYRGVPLVIHHTEIDPHIREENLIETRDDIVAHFRISE